MKKFIMSVLCCLVFTAAGAKNVDDKSNIINKANVNYTVTINANTIPDCYQLTEDQKYIIDSAVKSLKYNIKKLKNVKDEEKQEKLQKYLYKNLAEVKSCVNIGQYRVYLHFLNDDFNRNGLSSILYGYSK